jgi:hypothetical protein
MSETQQRGEPTWQQSFPVEGPPDGGTISAGIQCTNIPTDGYVAVTMPGPDQANSLDIPRTPIPNPNWQIFQQLQWPANFSTEMTITYWQGATAPPAGASINPVLMVPVADSVRVDANVECPFWQKTVALTVTAGITAVGVECRNMPIDAAIAISSPGPRQGRGIYIPRTLLGDPNRTFVVPVDWTEGLQTILVVSYWQGVSTPEADAVVTPFLLVSSPDGERVPPTPVRQLAMGWQALSGKEAI